MLATKQTDSERHVLQPAGITGKTEDMPCSGDVGSLLSMDMPEAALGHSACMRTFGMPIGIV